MSSPSPDLAGDGRRQSLADQEPAAEQRSAEARRPSASRLLDLPGLVARLAMPVLAALVVVPYVKPNGTFWPWRPSTVDLDVYQYIGHVLLSGGDILTARTPTDYLAFIYPPFAALLCIPLVVVPHALLQVLMTAGNALAVVGVLHRLGLRAWALSLVATGCVLLVEPIRETIGFGQINTMLMALVVIDLVPRRAAARRDSRAGTPAGTPGTPAGNTGWLPRGVLTGIAAAIKVTPALFLVTEVFARRWRTAATMAVTAGGITLLTALVMPRETLGFATALLGGDTRTGSASFLFDQSTLAAALRLLGDTGTAHYLGLGIGAVFGLVAAWAAAGWLRRGQPLFAVALCGVGTLVASPLSWTHHFVWVVPMGAAVVLGRDLPLRVRLTAGAWTIWFAAGLYKLMPWENNAELSYNAVEKLISVVGPVLGLALIALAALDARRSEDRTERPIRETHVVR